VELKKYRLFWHKWQSVHFQDGDQVYTHHLFTVRHLKWGVLRCLFDPITAVTPQGELHLYSFQPLTRETAQTFVTAARTLGTKPHRLTSWPI
jgi:hypothetical protein